MTNLLNGSLQLRNTSSNKLLLLLRDLSNRQDLLDTTLAELDVDAEELELLAADLLEDLSASLGIGREGDVRGRDEAGLACCGSKDEVGELGAGWKKEASMHERKELRTYVGQLC